LLEADTVFKFMTAPGPDFPGKTAETKSETFIEEKQCAAEEPCDQGGMYQVLDASGRSTTKSFEQLVCGDTICLETTLVGEEAYLGISQPMDSSIGNLTFRQAMRQPDAGE
jgi:hypothetical protein